MCSCVRVALGATAEGGVVPAMDHRDSANGADRRSLGILEWVKERISIIRDPRGRQKWRLR